MATLAVTHQTQGAVVRYTFGGASSAPAVITPTDRARAYIENASSRNTVRGYRSSWRLFEAWCLLNARQPLPAAPETIAAYLGDQAQRLKPQTLEHHLSAINKAHKAAGFPSPTRDNVLVAETLKGVKRVHGCAATQKAPVCTDDLRLMLRKMPDKLLGQRDRALLLCGFCGGFRRSELVGLDVSDLAFTPEGLLLTLRRSKTDQEGVGRKVAIPYATNAQTCAAAALKAWLEASGITDGAVFHPVNRHGQLQPGRLTGHAVALVVKRYATAAGLDPATLAGHSLRAGLVTSAARAGVPERVIMQTTGHKSVEMVLRYVRAANQFKENAVNALGL